MEILIFEIAGQRFGVAASVVNRVFRATAITRLPGAPDAVEGVLDVQGRLVPVYDLRRRFGIPPRDVSPSQHLVVASVGEKLVAFRVDRATSVSVVDESGFENPAVGGKAAPHVAGIGRLDDGLVVIHDLERFLTAPEEQQLDGSLAAMSGAG